MSHGVTPEALMRYLDDELPPDERAAVERHIAGCSECAREVALYRTMGSELRRIGLQLQTETVWSGVSRRIAQPVGWALVIAGVLVWTAWGVYAWWTGPDSFVEKTAAGGVVIGLALLLTSALIDRLIDLRTDPYRRILR